MDLCKYADCVFMALHGDSGEDGKIQSVFELLGVAYTGSDSKGSALAMDKEISKKIVSFGGTKTAGYFYIKNLIDLETKREFIRYPVVVKPISGGSSIGVSIVSTPQDLVNACKKAFLYDKEVIAEEFIEGRELSVGVLDGEALPPIEILPIDAFYDYEHKYQKDLAMELCPASLSDEENKNLKKLTLKIHNDLKLGFYSRIDFILNKNGEFVFLEANTLPGMTPTSLLPQEAEKTGVSFQELCEKIVENAFKTKKRSC